MREVISVRPGGRVRRRRLTAAVAIFALSASTLAAVEQTSVGAPAPAPAAAQQGGVDVSPALTAATFADPPATVRPKYRWWLPLAYTDDDELAAELHQMKQAGAGGAEVAAFGVDGAGNNTNPFLQTYGWGTPLWAQKVATMLAAAKADNLRLDFTIGPRWPATVPSVSDLNDPAAAKQIIFSSEFHPGGSSRDGSLPTNFDTAPPAGADKTLIAALVARCTDPTCGTQQGSPRLLDKNSVVDVTSQVGADGNLSYTFPGDSHSTYALIAFYQTATGQSLSGYTATGRNYVLDTLSVAGAKATTDFYDDNILTPDVQHLIGQIGDADLFEDSLEIGSTEKWTSDFVQEWTKRRGYSPITVLPALAGTGDQGITDAPYFDFGDGIGARVRTDYRQTWSDLYIANRLDTLRAWTHRHGMHTRIQPYGVPVDASEAATHIDVPEGESLAFGESSGDYSNVEDYKVVATGAHLAGEPVVSDECCAFSGSVWASTAGGGSDQSNLQAVYRGFAGGVNQVVWHGFPYLTRGPEGAGSQEVWPGMSYGGNTSYSAAFGAKGGPNWADYRQVNDDVARMQLVLRQGKPRFDVAVYWHDFGMNGGGNNGYGSNRVLQSSSSLAAAGYTYEYVSPAQLQRPDAIVRQGELFPDASAYHAVVLADQPTMSVDAARRLVRIAQSGLPVVIVGALPSTTPGYDADGQDATLKQVVGQLVQQRSVVRVADESAVPAALQRAGVQAAAAHATTSPAILDVRRHTDSVDYYYLYNQGATATAQTLTLAGSGRPYLLNTWTGKITPIAQYTSGQGTVTVPVRLAGNDAEVVAVTPRRDATFHGAAGAPGGGSAQDAGASAQPVALGDWSLSVDSWTPGPSDLPGDTAHTTVGPVALKAAADGTLPAWSAITPANGYPVDLSDVSGVGTYATKLTLGRNWNAVTGAHLDLGIPVDTVRVAVNGRALPPLDQADLRHVDVGPYLQPGTNTISVQVSSTLINAVRVAPDTGASGRGRTDYGLFGPVTLTPYAGASSYLTSEALERSLPLADGGYNRSNLLVTNESARQVQVVVDAAAPTGITTHVPARATTIGPRQSVVVPVDVRDAGLSTGASTLTLTARASNGLRSVATVALRHSGNLALNDSGAPYPHPIGDASQDRYPAELALDSSASTFSVAWGKADGQGPSPEHPVHFGVDLGAPVPVSSVTVHGRSSYGPRTYDVQTSVDGRRWQTVASVVDGPLAGQTSAFEQVDARYVRIVVTQGWDARNRNIQMTGFEVHSSLTPVGDLIRYATMTASSSHSGYPVSLVNDGATDPTPWCSRNAGYGWNDNTKGVFPDSLTATWTHPVQLSRVVVDTLDLASCPYAGISDYDVQVSKGGDWQTVASVRGNTAAVVTSTFAASTTDALRILILDSNDHSYSRVVEVEGYAS